MSAPWSGRELAVLRRHYPAGASGACLRFLPRRSKRAIIVQATRLQIRTTRKERP
ncbi:hypothetical protein [Sphingomonas jatrophae]|uniref:Transposase n=1 Tax=Sphingomonas jatrophae TaxID=1166337 RepID=A0A1I6K6W9_9SPHN|nr:hypothetical protein [Sphingomonas jatrophae]SFR86808.1 hypothetical protein SAMN05192580_1378 [Sphingomonas jatrophae]